MTRVFANDTDYIFAAHDFAVLAEAFYGRADFHGFLDRMVCYKEVWDGLLLRGGERWVRMGMACELGGSLVRAGPRS